MGPFNKDKGSSEKGKGGFSLEEGGLFNKEVRPWYLFIREVLETGRLMRPPAFA